MEKKEGIKKKIMAQTQASAHTYLKHLEIRSHEPKGPVTYAMARFLLTFGKKMVIKFEEWRHKNYYHYKDGKYKAQLSSQDYLEGKLYTVDQLHDKFMEGVWFKINNSLCDKCELEECVNGTLCMGRSIEEYGETL